MKSQSILLNVLLLQVMLCAKQGQPDVTERGLDLLDAMASFRTTPVRYDPRHALLIKAYRQEELKSSRSAKDPGGGGYGTGERYYR
jgi:hypothetical protein